MWQPGKLIKRVFRQKTYDNLPSTKAMIKSHEGQGILSVSFNLYRQEGAITISFGDGEYFDSQDYDEIYLMPTENIDTMIKNIKIEIYKPDSGTLELAISDYFRVVCYTWFGNKIMEIHIGR